MTVSHCRQFTVAGGRRVPQGLLTDINFQSLSFSAMLNSQQMAEIDTTLPHLQLKFIDSTVTSSSISYHTCIVLHLQFTYASQINLVNI